MPLTPRVLFVDHTAQLGGAELSLFDLASRTPSCRVALFEDGPLVERLNEAGVETTVVQAPSLKGVRRDTKLLSGISALRGVMQSARGVARLGRAYDVLYANSQKGWVVAALASLLCRKPVVWHLHDILTGEHFSKANIRIVVALANRLASAVIANSQATRQAFIDAGGRAELVHVIYNGIDPGLFQKREVPPRTMTGIKAADAEPIKPIEAPVVACVGRLCPWKGQHIFLEAIAKTPGVTGWVVGAALFGEDDYAQSLVRQAESLGIQDRVVFMGFCEDIASLLSRCDILAHTSTSPEPFGRVLVEAMFAGVAVIATRGGGPSELIDHGRTGLLVPPSDADALAQAIKALASNPDSRTRQVDAACRDANQRFALDVVVPQVHTLVKQMISVAQGKAPKQVDRLEAQTDTP